MYDDGYHNIVNVDVCIPFQRRRWKLIWFSSSTLVWSSTICLDCMKRPDHQWDVRFISFFSIHPSRLTHNTSRARNGRQGTGFREWDVWRCDRQRYYPKSCESLLVWPVSRHNGCDDDGKGRRLGTNPRFSHLQRLITINKGSTWRSAQRLQWRSFLIIFGNWAMSRTVLR